MKWISRVPLSIKKAKILVGEVKNESLKNSEIRGYRYSAEKVTYGGVEQRWLVVESEERKKERKKILDRRKKEAEKADKDIAKIIKLEFQHPSSALTKISEIESKLKYQKLIQIETSKKIKRRRNSLNYL